MTERRDHFAPSLIVRSDWATLQVVGPERTTWLDRILAQQLTELRAGQFAYSLLLDNRGRLACDVCVAWTSSCLWLGVDEAQATDVLQLLDDHLIMEDAEVMPSEQRLAWGQLLGWESGGATELVGLDGVEAVCKGVWGDVETTILLVDAESRQQALRSLRAQGVDVVDISSSDSIRLVAGVPLLGKDLTPGRVPAEMGMDGVGVALNKGCYLGQEGVARVRARGKPGRSLQRVVFESSGHASVAAGADVVDEGGNSVGKITTSAFVESVGRCVAFAVLRRAALRSGVMLHVEEKRIEAIQEPWGWLEW